MATPSFAGDRDNGGVRVYDRARTQGLTCLSLIGCRTCQTVFMFVLTSDEPEGAPMTDTRPDLADLPELTPR